MFTVRCPKCQHDQLYRPKKVLKSKRCVYCGRSFVVHPDLVNTRIVCRGKRAEFNAPLM